MATKNNDKEIYCSFCGKPQDMVLRMIQGNGAYICDRCVDLCMNILEQSGEIERDNSKKPLCQPIFHNYLSVYRRIIGIQHD